MTKRRGCEIKSVFGYSLYEAVLFVAVFTIVLSMILFLSSLVSLVSVSSTDNVSYQKQPVLGMNLIFALVAICMSPYQVIISLLLLWQAKKVNDNIFLSMVWYVSHLSIMTVYFILFTGKAVICFVQTQYLSGTMTCIGGILYEAVFIYFSIIVNSYSHSIEENFI